MSGEAEWPSYLLLGIKTDIKIELTEIFFYEIWMIWVIGTKRILLFWLWIMVVREYFFEGNNLNWSFKDGGCKYVEKEEGYSASWGGLWGLEKRRKNVNVWPV